MSNEQTFNKVFFLGIGGIGMSALARYYQERAYRVAGYDLTPSPLIEDLEKMGIQVTFDSSVAALNLDVYTSSETLVIYTPAIPKDHPLLLYFRSHGYYICKRAEALGIITRNKSTLCVAGTHGKTTTSTILAHLMASDPQVECSAFLGGISNNFQSNYLYSNKSNYVVVEADEFDRSFLHLYPDKAIVTSIDPDHLDIYGSYDALQSSFNEFISQIRPGGFLILKHGLQVDTPSHIKVYTYGDTPDADIYYSNIRIQDGRMFFDWHFPSLEVTIADIEQGVPVRINVENSTAAMAVAFLSGVSPEYLKQGVQTFRGSHRRFETVFASHDRFLIDDYAHHPKELEVSIRSVRELHPDKRLMGIFQPHLYTRTRDFYEEFAQSLSLLDEVILLEIYPAREEPIEGITSQIIFDRITSPNKRLIPKEQLIEYLKSQKATLPPVIMMMGAGNIDRLVQPVKDLLESV